MGEHRGEPYEPGRCIDRGGLDGRNLMLAQRLANDVESARQRGIAEGAVGLAGERRADGGGERLLRIGEFRLGFGQRAGDGAD